MSVSLTVGGFLILLGVVGRRTNPHIVGGRGGIARKSCFSYCWKLFKEWRVTFRSHMSRIVGSRVEVCSLSRIIGSCRAENHFFHIVVGSQWEGHFLSRNI